MAEPDPSTLPPEARGTAPSRSRLANRRILVVGGGQADFAHIKNPPIGNGRAICVLFAKEGASVAVHDLRIESAKRTVEMIGESVPSVSQAKYCALQGDASDEKDVIRVIREAETQLGGPIDGLVCNVGIAEGIGMEGTSSDDWDRTFAVNVRSHFLFCKHLLPRMPRGSSILLISSVAARTAGSNLPACGEPHHTQLYLPSTMFISLLHTQTEPPKQPSTASCAMSANKVAPSASAPTSSNSAWSTQASVAKRLETGRIV